MTKTNAERQRQYRERKKLKGVKYLEKGRKRKKKYYQKVENLIKDEQKTRRETVRGRVQKHQNSVKKVIDSFIEKTSTVAVESVSPLVVNIKFSKREESFRKRKHQRNDRVK